MAASGGDAKSEVDREPKAGAGSSASADGKPQWLQTLVSGWQQVLGGESCIGSRRKPDQKQGQKQSGQPKMQVDRWSPLGKTSFECCWDRADLANFLGVPDKEPAVRDMLFTHVSQVIYAAGHEICAVSLPFVNQAAQGNVTTYGWLRSAQSLVSVGGTIAFGRFADVYGTRAAMVVAHSAAFAYSAIIAVASSQEVLFVTILPCVVLHGFQAAQLVAATRSTPETRGHALGQVTLSYGLGFVAGSVVLVASGNRLHPRAAAAIAAGVEAVFVVALLRCDVLDDGLSIVDGVQDPLTALENTDAVVDTHISAAAPQSVAARLLRLFSVAGVPQILFVKFGIISASGLVLNMVPQFALDPFGVGTSQSALLMAYMSLVQMVTQAGAGRYLDSLDDTKACSDTWEKDSPYNRLPASLKIVVLGGGTISLSLLAIILPEVLGHSFDVLRLPMPWTIEGPWTAALASARPVVYWRAFAFWIGPLAAAQQVVLNAMSTELTKRAPHQDLGLVLGVDMAMFSGTGVATPLAAAWLMQHYGFSAVPLAGASLASATVGSMMLLASSMGTRSNTDDQDSKSAAVYGRAPAAPRVAYRRAGQKSREEGSELKVPTVAAIAVTDDELGQ